MSEYTHVHRAIDTALLIVLPGFLLILAVLSMSGYSFANFGESYVFLTEVISIIIVAVCPFLRLKGIIRMPYWFIAIVTSDVYIHSVMLFLGFYQNLDWWDHFTHFYSSLVVTMVVFMGLAILEKYILKISLMPKVVFLSLVFLIGFGFGNIWEVFEWLIDTVFGEAFMQYSVYDTLGDVAMDAAGAFVMTVIGACILHFKSPDEIITDLGIDDKIDSMKAAWIEKYGE